MVLIWKLKNSSFGNELVPSICMQYVGQRLQLYTVRGEVVYLLPRLVAFSISGFVSLAELSPVLPLLPTQILEHDEQGEMRLIETVVLRETGAHLLDRMLRLNKLADEVYRKYADRFDRAWDIMKGTGDPNSVHLEDMAMIVCQQKDRASVSTPMLWCMIQVVESNPAFIANLRHRRLDPSFKMLSSRANATRRTVAEWVRQFQERLASDTIANSDHPSVSSETDLVDNPIETFMQKARTLVQRSRKVRDAYENGRLGPSKIRAKHLPVDIEENVGDRIDFDKNDMKIIRFLYDWAVERTVISSSSLGSVGPAILRAIGTYDNFDFERPTGLQLLQELGVLLPWEDRYIYLGKYGLPGHGTNYTADELRKVAASSVLTMEDSMADLRKDWGNLPVFCVDSADTADVDDGISWEPIDETTYWAHIHVANPSAFLKPDSPIAQYAAKITQTFYFPERSYPMLESNPLLRHCSLAANAPSITFSARLNTGGEILETKISHGIIRNVKRLTYETLNSALSPHLPADSGGEESGTALVVGGELATKYATRPNQTLTEAEDLTESEASILQKLMEIGQARRLKRVEGTDIDPRLGGIQKIEPTVYLGDDHPPFGPCLTHSRKAVGDPIISLHTKPFDPDKTMYVSPGRQMVTDFMLLAGEIAAQWCAERGIPTGYLGTRSSPQQQLTKRKYMEEVHDPIVARYGHVPPLLTWGARGHIQTFLSVQPTFHEFLNTPQYVQATSPLRRFGDLFTHWQIDAAVRQEARTGTSLVGNTDHSFLPFDLDRTQAFVEGLEKANAHTSLMKKSARRHWIIQWFSRAHYHHEAPLPKPLHIVILSIDPVWNHNLAVIKELGIHCETKFPPNAKPQDSLEVGDTWEADVLEVDTSSLNIFVNPIRLVQKSAIDYQSYLFPKAA